MREIESKYKSYRDHDAQDGDIILWRGKKGLAKPIQFFDKDPLHGYKAWGNHTSIIMWDKWHNRLENLESWFGGVTKVPASYRVNWYEDFIVLRPVIQGKVLENALIKMSGEWHEGTGYDVFTLPRVAIKKSTGIDFTMIGDPETKRTCARFCQVFANEFSETYKNIIGITPEDFIRYGDGSFKVLYDLYDNRPKEYKNLNYTQRGPFKLI